MYVLWIIHIVVLNICIMDKLLTKMKMRCVKIKLRKLLITVKS